MGPTSNPLIDLLVNGGAIGVLAWIALSFATGKLRTEKELNRVIAERDRALDLVYKSAEIANAAIKVAESEVAKKG